jgi:hypothetical protein
VASSRSARAFTAERVLCDRQGAYPVSTRAYQVTSMKQISVRWLVAGNKCRPETSYRCFTNVEAHMRRDLPAPERGIVGRV